MTTLAEKFAAAKTCCREVKDSAVEKTRKIYDRLFDGDWEVFVIKQDEATGKLIGRTVCCALGPV
jgi:thymidylate kinase